MRLHPPGNAATPSAAANDLSGALPGGVIRSVARHVQSRDEMWAALARAAQGRAAAAPLDGIAARQWLDRARRIAPDDTNIALSLGLACLSVGDLASAIALFEDILQRYDLVEARAGLAAAALQAGQPARAAAALQSAFSRATTAPVLFPLAAAVAQAAGFPGWCAIASGGLLHADAQADLSLDGSELSPRWVGGRCRIPAGVRLEVRRAGVALLGSPIDLAAIDTLEGFVRAADGGVSGWGWYPNDPDRDPLIIVTAAGGSLQAVAREESGGMIVSTPLARPRQFHFAADRVPPGVLRVTGPDGRDLLGSPLDPGLERRSAAGLATGFQPIWADMVGPAPAILPPRRKVDVVVPVYRGVAQTVACLESVLAALPNGCRVHIVDDASPDPRMAPALAKFARQPGVRLTRQPHNKGFPAAANAGLTAAAGRDAVLLNSDTLVTPGWLESLQEAIYSAPDIGTACPLSNEATILSYPQRHGGNPMPDLAETAVLAALARRANGSALVDIPVAVGSCVLIRRDCLAQTGLLREDLFAQGYGEENDFCLRARHRGWRHVAVAGAFVAHAGGVSFGAARQHLQERNIAVLERLHPGYGALIQAWQLADPLAPARRAMDALRWRSSDTAKRSAIIVTHTGGGGVDRVVAARGDALRDQGIRPVVLRPDHDAVAIDGDSSPNLRFTLPAEWSALVRFLRASRPTHIEMHHLLGHSPAMVKLAAALRVPYDIFVHDYAWFCPRIALVPQHAYCGEPATAVCEACVADYGSLLEEDITVAHLVRRSADTLAGARRVIAPAADVAIRIQRHFPAIQAEITPWQDDGAIEPPPAWEPRPADNGALRVCIVGGIGVEKGYEVLLACVRDAEARGLKLAFTIVGYTADDERLLKAGPVFITGSYDDAEAVALIQEQRADLAWLPSIWPETWCFTLGLAWRAGLRAAVFDIGAPAERVRRTGWGWVLPLGLPAASINDWMLRQARRSRTTSPVAGMRAYPAEAIMLRP